MSRSPSFDDPLRPLSPADLQTTAVHAGTALICAEAAFQAAAEPVAAALRRRGWTSSLAADLDRARWLASVRQPHVVIILGQTPRWSAHAAMTIRGVTTAPVLVLAEFGRDGHARLLESGADMVSGTGASETWLIAAVTALVRRHRPARPALRYLECQGLRLDLVAHKVTLDGAPCEMPPSEFVLLRYLMTHPQVALRHSTIIKAVWDWKYSDERNALRICVNRLRKRLGDTASEPRFIQSLRGFGYSFVLPVSQFAADLSEPGSLDADSSLHELAAESRSLSAGLLAAPTLREAAGFLVDSVVRDGICDAAAVMVRDGKMLQLVAQAGNTPAWQASVARGVPLARGFVAADSVLSGQTRHFVNIVEMSKHYSSTAGLMREADLPVLLSIPLANRTIVWGHIGFAARGGGAFPPAQLMLLEGVGHLLGALAGQDLGEPAADRAAPANSRAASLCRAYVEAAPAVAWRWPDTYAPNSKREFTAAVSQHCGHTARNGFAVLFAFIIRSVQWHSQTSLSGISSRSPCRLLDGLTSILALPGYLARSGLPRSGCAAISRIQHSFSSILRRTSSAIMRCPHWPVSVSPPSA
jgi:DNA-binding response OmpR family regulator